MIDEFFVMSTEMVFLVFPPEIPNHLPDEATHLALTYNGLAWEISGLANKEKNVCTWSE